MSPVFGHGRLRLYLLKLLEESPRHGYEVIRLLQDRFLGVYSPSPGTIYPRLARLEEEGLVTHEVVEGKKVFTLTDKGREELNARLDELAELEQEISDSVRDIAREVKEDVRDTVRSLREELTQMAREMRGGTREAEREAKKAQREAEREMWRERKEAFREHQAQWRRQKRDFVAETKRWKQEWLAQVWGQSTWAPQETAEEADELGRMLADFVDEVRQDATEGRVTPEVLATAQDALYEAATKIKNALRP